MDKYMPKTMKNNLKGDITMKKTLAIISALSITALTSTAFAAASFPDMPETHWAYSYVTQLVENGTVNGDESGNFNPDAHVTRAQFVKMLGKGTTEAQYTDVDTSHWGYEYIKTSGVAPDESGAFRPDEDMTRGDIAELLWLRAGSPENATAPESVTSQHKSNPKAAAWVYEKGIITGYEDGSMGYDSTVTRAEAAAIIIRATDMKEESVPTQAVVDGTKAYSDGKLEKAAVSADKSKYTGDTAWAYILDEVPAEVYAAPIGNDVKPEDNLKFANDFAPLFTTVTQKIENILKEQYGSEVKTTFYPSLSWNTGKSYKYRVKFEFVKAGEKATTYKDMIGGTSEEKIVDGMVLYADIETDYAFGMGIGAFLDVSDPVYIVK